MEIVIRISPDGKSASLLYTEALDLSSIGQVEKVERASNVEWNHDSRGWIISTPGGVFVAGPFSSRSEAIAEEIRILNSRLQRGERVPIA